MKCVIAPDKFRGSLTAAQAADAIVAGLTRIRPDLQTQSIPVADGGEGTVEAALAAGFTPHTITVRGPLAQPVLAKFARRGATAVIEMAQASGLGLLDGAPTPRSALTTSTYGTGELVRAALDQGATRIILGVGGSATTDGGVGLVTALGARFIDEHGQPLSPGGGSLLNLSSVDVAGLDVRMAAVELVLATDVDNPLVGPQEAAFVFGPQKGADADTVERLDLGLRRLAVIVHRSTGRNTADLSGAGAAGGIGATAIPLLGAEIASGSDILLRMLGLPEAIADADCVVTGEGSLDEQSLHGKAAHGVAQICGSDGPPVIAIAGRVTVDDDQLSNAGFKRAYSLAALEPDPRRSMAHAADLLARISETVACDWLMV